MNILLIDTASDYQLVQVLSGEKPFISVSDEGKSHSKNLFTNINSTLMKAEINIQEIDLIAVGTGPGSFTGIRIAVATARALCQLLKKPLMAINSQLIYSLSDQFKPGDVVLCGFDAKKERLFAGAYMINDDSGDHTEILHPGDYTPDYIITKTNDYSDIICIGNGIERYHSKFEGKGFKIKENFHPEGTRVFKYIETTFHKNPELSMNYKTILPSYSRKSDAEVALSSK